MQILTKIELRILSKKFKNEIFPLHFENVWWAIIFFLHLSIIHLKCKANHFFPGSRPEVAGVTFDRQASVSKSSHLKVVFNINSIRVQKIIVLCSK